MDRQGNRRLRSILVGADSSCGQISISQRYIHQKAYCSTLYHLEREWSLMVGSLLTLLSLSRLPKKPPWTYTTSHRTFPDVLQRGMDKYHEALGLEYEQQQRTSARSSPMEVEKSKGRSPIFGAADVSAVVPRAPLLRSWVRKDPTSLWSLSYLTKKKKENYGKWRCGTLNRSMKTKVGFTVHNSPPGYIGQIV